jgi:pentatricopeptide repeat protein
VCVCVCVCVLVVFVGVTATVLLTVTVRPPLTPLPSHLTPPPSCFRLVLDLFELYSTIAADAPPAFAFQPPRAPRRTGNAKMKDGGRGGRGGRGGSGGRGGRGGGGVVAPPTLAPYLYSVPLHSLAELKDVEGMLRLMTEDMPSRGFVPRTGFYVFAIKTLLKNGKPSL